MKAQKLKKQFRAWEEIHQAPPLKTDHRAVFRKRLGKRKTSTFQVRLLQWAAVAIVCIGLANALGFFAATVSEEEVRFQKAEATITGSGYIEMHCSDQFSASITGSGDIVCYGNPEKQQIKTTGSGDVLIRN
jgi:tryptophan synthase beta subunit